MKVLLVLLCLLNHQGSVFAQSATPVNPVQRVAILPPLIYLDKQQLHYTDSVAIKQITRNEALSNQRNSYYQLTAKNRVSQVAIQDITETNRLLENAGITYEILLNTSPGELARILNTDLILTGICSSKKQAFNAEQASTMLATAFLTSGRVWGSRGRSQTVNGVQYILFNTHTNAAIWEFSDNHPVLSTNYLDNLRAFFRKTYADRE